MNEFEWEKLLKESDVRAEKLRKLYETYLDHPERDEIIAREMGWSKKGEISDEDPLLLGQGEDDEGDLEFDLEPNPLTEGVDWEKDESGNIHHPLTIKILKRAVKIWQECEDQNLLENKDVGEMVFHFQATGAKVAGALDGLAYDSEKDGGFVVACLKRALAELHQSVGKAAEVKKKNLMPSVKLEEFQKMLFEVREEILGLMERFRKESEDDSD